MMVHSAASGSVPTCDDGKTARELDRWSVEELPDPKLPGYVLARVVSECDVVCSISGAVVCGDWGRHPLHSGRARLIAAAPELLEALTGLLGAYSALVAHVADDEFDIAADHPASWASKADAAIRKALGES